jgi:sestrin
MGEVIDVDTSAFRRAIWYYIHCLYGIMHDDYDYGQVNQLLERNLKAYIKTVTCYPERLAKKDYDNVMKEFKHSEKVLRLGYTTLISKVLLFMQIRPDPTTIYILRIDLSQNFDLMKLKIF